VETKSQVRIRILLVHGRVLFRESLARLLAAEHDFRVVTECSDVDDAIRAAGELNPDVVLLDFAKWQSFFDAARKGGYQGSILALAEGIEPSSCSLALSRGVSGVFLSSDPPTRLVRAIRLVADGGVWVPRSVIQQLAARYPHYEEESLNGLTARERAVLSGILGGLTNREIADQLGASESGIKSTLQGLFFKTGVRTRSQLVRIMLASSSSGMNN
jgi:DNA-binding NarL/FixJ family response regulator